MTKYLLKVLAGPHRGAELLLEEGEFVIGTGEDCDIILTDPLLAEEHAKLHIRERAIELVPLADPVFIGKDQVGREGKEVPSFQLFILGEAQMAIGPSEAQWPAIAPIALSDLESQEEKTLLVEEKEKAPELLQPEAPSSSPKKKIEPPSPLASEKKEGVKQETSDLSVKEKKVTTRRRLSWSRILFWGALGTLGMFLGVLMLLAAPLLIEKVNWKEWKPSFPSFSMWKPPLLPDEETLVLEMLEKQGLSNALRVERNNEGRLLITGYVENNFQRHKLIGELQQVGRGTFQIRIWSEEGMIRSAIDVLESLNLQLTVTAGTPGALRFSGRIPEQPLWLRARRVLFADVSGLQSIDDEQVVFGESLPEKSILIDLSISSVNLGSMPWITLKNGNKYFQGALLPNGYIIEQIAADGIRLIRGADVRILEVENVLWKKAQ